MSICEAIQKRIDELDKLIYAEPNKDVREKYKKEMFALMEEKNEVAAKEICEEIKYNPCERLLKIDLTGIKKLSDKEYLKIKQKWEAITGETLYSSEENRYHEHKKHIIEELKDKNKEDMEALLKHADYEWEHRKAIARRRIERETEMLEQELDAEIRASKKHKKQKVEKPPRSMARNALYKKVVNVTLKEE